MNIDGVEGVNNNLKEVSNTPVINNINVSTDTPVEETKNQLTADEIRNQNLDIPYLENRSITISLCTNYSLYRKANSKVLSERRDKIGSSVSSSRILSSNPEELKAYFPSLIGVAYNNENFITRVKAYLNNISILVTELGKTFDISFNWYHYRDYLDFKRKEDAINLAYANTNKQSSKLLKEAINKKITDLNALESTRHRYGYPVNIEHYLMYRHCLLYKDIAKDVSLINSDPSIRFYFKDDKREAEKQAKLRTEINNAKVNYVRLLSDSELFDAVYIQYCVLNGISLPIGINTETMEKQNHLDKMSSTEPIKFNRICGDKDIIIKSYIETLISRGLFVRSEHNQNITTPEGEFIGANIKEAVSWFKNPANTALVAALKNKLKSI